MRPGFKSPSDHETQGVIVGRSHSLIDASHMGFCGQKFGRIREGHLCHSELTGGNTGHNIEFVMLEGS